MDTDNRFAYLEIDTDEAPALPFTAPAPIAPPRQLTVDEFVAQRQQQEYAARAGRALAEAAAESARTGRQVAVNDLPQVEAPRNTITDNLVRVVEQADATTGGITYFRSTGGIQLDALRKAWLAEGLDEKSMLKEPTLKAALARAMKTFDAQQTMLDEHPMGGWQIVSRTISAGTTQYAPLVRVYIQDKAIMVDAIGATEQYCQAVRNTVSVEVARALVTVTGADVGSWLVGIIENLHGVALRSTGGIYFVPPADMPQLRKVRAACLTVGIIVHEIPAVRSRETIEAVLESVARECTEQLTKVRLELAADHGKRWVASRCAELDALESKLTTYERFLGMSLDGARTDAANTRALLNAYSTRAALLEVE